DSDKISVRIQNELYLRSHPEIANILNYFVNQALKRQPTNIPAFAAELLGDPQLEEKVTRYAQDAEEFQKTVGGLT
ncbi:uncharacterized protein BJ171DRAFT_462367, partial [Polychytrium aggregatum]|uniref:uncharacterized protein n=1 Tax=Polychytrium aggregatum TaxID=110093 RepID=UPI0022FEA7AB